jgi:hypothetical protein
MQNKTMRLLFRSTSLEKGDGLRRARSMAHMLNTVGLLLASFVGYAVAFRLHPILIAAAAAATVGWIMAERNALRTRITQWPILRSYIDWQRVQQDFNRDA